ncbi:hypothetical protein DPMN_127446 [Dreissena polymorpha]|uniref:Uncharacterized protein n=1 Tax=Dreissena polymorpha TaxID=45954 RepID=A0A9D4H1Z2_DREPO|nr:hypothetical protein DPMN_127446 [Dreissena polymorpha]
MYTKDTGRDMGSSPYMAIAREIGRTVRHSSQCKVTDTDLQDIFTTLTNLLSDQTCLIHDVTARDAVKKLAESPEYLSTLQSHTWLLGKQVLSVEEIKLTAFVTSGQWENALLAAVRKLRFTASNFALIISAAKRNRLTASLKKRLLSAYNLEKRSPIQMGITHERNAIDDFCKARIFGFTSPVPLVPLQMDSFRGSTGDLFTCSEMGNVIRHHRNQVPIFGKGHDCCRGMLFQYRLLLR